MSFPVHSLEGKAWMGQQNGCWAALEDKKGREQVQ